MPSHARATRVVAKPFTTRDIEAERIVHVVDAHVTRAGGSGLRVPMEVCVVGSRGCGGGKSFECCERLSPPPSPPPPRREDQWTAAPAPSVDSLGTEVLDPSWAASVGALRQCHQSKRASAIRARQ